MMLDPLMLHLIEQTDSWNQIKDLFYITSPLLVTQAMFVLGVINPPLALAAGIGLSMAKGSVFGMTKSVGLEMGKQSSSPLVSETARQVSTGLGYLGILNTYAEVGSRLGEVISREMDKKRTASFSPRYPSSWHSYGESSMAGSAATVDPKDLGYKSSWLDDIDTLHPEWRSQAGNAETLGKSLGVSPNQIHYTQPR